MLQIGARHNGQDARARGRAGGAVWLCPDHMVEAERFGVWRMKDGLLHTAMGGGRELDEAGMQNIQAVWDMPCIKEHLARIHQNAITATDDGRPVLLHDLCEGLTHLSKIRRDWHMRYEVQQ